MKKQLLVFAGALLAFSSASAQVGKAQVVEDMMFSAMSPNGVWTAGSNMATYGVDVMNLETGEVFNIFPEGYDEELTLGTGANSISNDGIVLISTTMLGTASYIKDGEIYSLPVPDQYTSAYANAITPDGSRIAGTVGFGLTYEDITMQHPVVWNRNADGTYGMPVELDYPQKDFTGRVPQYILVDGISADGKTLACQIHDYVGTVTQPLVYRENGGAWSYEAFGESFFNPYGYEFPEVGPRPNATDYMTPEQIEAYLAARQEAANLVEPEPQDFMTEEEYAAYLEASWSTGWAWAPDFMTEEEQAAYEEAQNYYWSHKHVEAADFLTGEAAEEYLAADEAWQMANGELEEAYWTCVFDGALFLMNTLAISPDGKYYATAASSLDQETWEEPVKTYVFDLDDLSYTVKEYEGAANLIPTYIANNGSMLLSKPATWNDPIGQAYYCRNLNADVLPLEEVAEMGDPEVYDFMKENMFHNIVTEEYDWENDELIVNEREMWVTGNPCCDAEMKTIVTWALNNWDSDSYTFAYSYILPMAQGIATSVNTTDATSTPSAEYFDLQGRRTTATATGVVIVRENGKVTKKLK